MTLTPLVISAIMAAVLDISALILLIVAYSEKRQGDKRWRKLTSDMVIIDADTIYPLDCDEILIGRHASADIRLMDLSVSRYHAMLNVAKGKWLITDLGSKSGVFVNGQQISSIRLRDGDIIQLGNRKVQFVRGRNDER